MPKTPPMPQQSTDIGPLLHRLGDRIATPAALGHAIVSELLAAAAAQGKRDGDRLEIPFTVRVKLPRVIRPAAAATPPGGTIEDIHLPVAVTICTHTCLTLPIAGEVCIERCETGIVQDAIT